VDGQKTLIDNFKARLGGLSFNQKVLLGAVATASIISVTVFALWLQKEDMAVLFTGLDSEDASAALEELSKQDVRAELTDGGSTIRVPESDVYRLRVDLMGKGVVTNGPVGFEIFDGKQYGLTEFLQNVNFKRALEGELTKTIESFQGVQSARVHLVLPQPSIFKKLESAATASVVLRLGRGARMADSQIAGIQSLVAGSVENLELDNVTVIDQNGKVLSSPAQDDETGRSESQLALRKEVEGYLSEKASSMLDTVLGAGRSIVRVDATLNFEKIDRERELYDPAQTVVRSEVRNEETNPSTGGTSENSTTNYEINRTVERIVGHVGGIKNLSVAVFVDGHYSIPEGGGSPVYEPLSDDELSQLQRVVQTAVGISAVRGDQIEVVNMQFRQNEDGLGGGGGQIVWLDLVTQYGGKAVLLALLAAMLLMLRRNLGRLLGGGSLTAAPAGRTAATAAAQEEEHFNGIPDMNEQIVGDIKDYASENPERVAEVIQSWIHGIDLGKEMREAAGS
jgi:flagellar M-ring protein FliF